MPTRGLALTKDRPSIRAFEQGFSAQLDTELELQGAQPPVHGTTMRVWQSFLEKRRPTFQWPLIMEQTIPITSVRLD